MKFPQYKGTVDRGDAWIGQHPSHWTVERAHFRLTSKRRSVSPAEMAGRQVIHYSIPNVQQHGAGILEEGDDIDSAKTQLFSPTLLVSKLNPHKTTVCLAEPSSDYMTVASGEFVPIESDQIDLTYARYLWSSSKVSDRLIALTQSVTRSHQRVSPEDIVKLEWAWPTLPEQRNIAAFLDRETARIDALIEKKRRLLELLEEKRLAIITQAVTKGLDPAVPMKDSGIEWLGEVPAHWTVGRVKHFARSFNGSTPSKAKSEYWEEGSVPWLSSGKVNEDVITEPSHLISPAALQECSLRMVPRGSIVVGIVGQGRTRGLSAYLDIDTTINQNIAAVVPQEVLNGRFLHFAFQHAYTPIRELGRGANQAALDAGLVSEIPLAVPPIEEQIEIVEQIEDGQQELRQVANRVQEAISVMTEYRSTLITNAVTGKIDVRNLVDDEAAA